MLTMTLDGSRQVHVVLRKLLAFFPRRSKYLFKSGTEQRRHVGKLFG